MSSNEPPQSTEKNPESNQETMQEEKPKETEIQETTEQDPKEELPNLSQLLSKEKDLASKDTPPLQPPSLDLDSSSSSTDSDTEDEEDKATPPQDPSEALIQATTLKEEGNAHFKKGDLQQASRSYRRGTTLLKPLNKKNTGDEQVKGLLISLYNNQSMMSFKQNKPKQSLDVATKALQVDPTNVKALYRRAVAYKKLGDFDKAKEDLKEALIHDADNAAVKKELLLLKREVEISTKKEKKRLSKAFSKQSGSFLYEDKEEEERNKKAAKKKKQQEEKEALEKRKLEWEDECVKRMSHDEPAITFEDWEKERKEAQEALDKKKREEEKQRKEEEKKARQAEKKARAATKTEDSDDDNDELTERELSMFRGYKKTKDGRTTSYFTREISEEEKNLLGNTAPKRLEQTTAGGAATPVSVTPTPEAQSSLTGKGTASAWNQAGTWEEKDTTDWCKSHLRSKLKSAVAREESYLALVTSVTDLTGDASVAMTGGKKRYIFDFHAKLSFEIRDDDVDEVLCSASLNLPDICSTSHDEVEVELSAWKTAPISKHQVAADKCRASLVHQVRCSVQEFVADFNAHY